MERCLIIIVLCFIFGTLTGQELYYYGSNGIPLDGLSKAKILREVVRKSDKRYVVRTMVPVRDEWKLDLKQKIRIKDEVNLLIWKNDTEHFFPRRYYRKIEQISPGRYLFQDASLQGVLRKGSSSRFLPLHLEGTVTEYHPGGMVKSISEYRDNQLVSNRNWLPDSTRYIDSIFYSTDTKPEFLPGAKFFNSYLLQQIRNSKLDLNEIEDEVVIGWVVIETGNLDGVIALQGKSHQLNQFLVETIEGMPGDWEPARLNGKAVRCFISINSHNPLPIPESPHIPCPQSEYAHHFNSVVPVDLSLLKEGTGNRFEFDVDTIGHWWPQNLVYGMVLRIYYEPFVVAKRSKITFPDPGDKIGLKAKVEFDHPEQKQVESIDLVGYYEDADMEGDGLYRKWHYAYHKGKIYRNIATLELMKKRGTWETEWLPDQENPMKLAAFVHMENGYSYMTEAVEGLILDRPDYCVELCKPSEIPEGWFTRNGEFSELFQVKGDPAGATEARLLFRSWSPGYFNGIYVNDFIVFVKEGPKYAYYEHNMPLDLHVLEKGENILKTGKTPKYHGKEVHGVEIQWPGIMVLIKYDPKEQKQKFSF